MKTILKSITLPLLAAFMFASSSQATCVCNAISNGFTSAVYLIKLNPGRVSTDLASFSFTDSQSRIQAEMMCASMLDGPMCQ